MGFRLQFICWSFRVNVNKAILGRVGVQTWEQGQTGVSTIEISVDFTGGHGVFQTFNTHTKNSGHRFSKSQSIAYSLTVQQRFYPCMSSTMLRLSSKLRKGLFVSLTSSSPHPKCQSGAGCYQWLQQRIVHDGGQFACWVLKDTSVAKWHARSQMCVSGKHASLTASHRSIKKPFHDLAASSDSKFGPGYGYVWFLGPEWSPYRISERPVQKSKPSGLGFKVQLIC
jgi:hypothetical protein